MPIAVSCPSCRSAYAVPHNLFGKKIRCSRCSGSFVVGAIPQVRQSAAVGAAHRSRPAGYPAERRSSGISGAVIGGSIVAAVFALVFVVGIGIVLHTKPANAPAPVAEASKATESKPAPAERSKDEPPAKQITEPPVPEPPPKEPVPQEPPPAVTGDGSLAPAILKRVKKATVFFRVTMPNNSVNQGSGFFAVEPGVVLTNAHVLGMLVGQTRRPKSVEVVLNSGQADERSLPAQILEVDRVSDLAVLRVNGNNLPEPLTIHVAKELQETQQVFVVGFPFGVTLGKEVSVRKSSVASLRAEAGELVKVQLEGGMDPGNSGGPIIDTRGQVVGVAVAGLRGTNINFAIPGEKVQAIVNGRIAKAFLGQPYRDGDKVKLPVTLHVVDPLGRIRQAGVDVWTGEPGKARPPGLTPPTLPKDSPRQRFLLELKDGVAGGELALPALPAGQVYWFQPVALNAAGQPRWTAASPIDNIAPPLERKPATLAFGFKAGSNFPLALGSTTKIRLERAGEDHTLVIGIDGQLAENTRTVDNKGTAAIRLDYLKMNMDVTMDGKPSNSNNRMQQSLPFLKDMIGDLRIDRQGNVLENKLDVTKVPQNARDGLTNVGDQVQQTIEALTVPLPGNEVKPGQTWTAQRSLPIDTAGKYDTGIMDMKYTYLGVRSRNGRDEAVISLSGTVRARQGVTQYISGKTNGTAVVDVATGLVTLAIASVDVDLDMTVNNQPAKADGALEMKLQRNLGGK
jgi:S1-C subfamily serine protease